jgi:hypothetical protein
VSVRGMRELTRESVSLGKSVEGCVWHTPKRYVRGGGMDKEGV